MMIKSKHALAAGVSAIALISLAGPAGAQSQDVPELRQQMRELQQRIDQLEGDVEQAKDAAQATSKAPSIQPEKDVRLTIAGRVATGVLYAEQGDQDQFFVVDNDAAESRFEFMGEKDFGDWTAGTKIFAGAELNSTDDITFGGSQSAPGQASVDFRNVSWYVEHPRFGELSVGKGDTSAEDSAHVDLSGTSFAGAGSDVDDIAGGLQFVDDQGRGLAELDAGNPNAAVNSNDDDELDDFFDMNDGERRVRVFYATPSLAGFSLNASMANSSNGSTVQPSVGFTYAASFNDFDVEAAGSWRRQEEGGGADDDFYVGSASVMTPFGINLTLAGSTSDLESSNAEDKNSLFAKLGYATDTFDIGTTAVSFDYFRGHSNDVFAAPDGDLPEATSFGLSAVQNIDALETELYVTGRMYDLDDVYVGATEQDVDDLYAVLTGARVRF